MTKKPRPEPVPVPVPTAEYPEKQLWCGLQRIALATNASFRFRPLGLVDSAGNLTVRPSTPAASVASFVLVSAGGTKEFQRILAETPAGANLSADRMQGARAPHARGESRSCHALTVTQQSRGCPA